MGGAQGVATSNKNWENPLHLKYFKIAQNIKSREIKCAFGDRPHQKSRQSLHRYNLMK